AFSREIQPSADGRERPSHTGQVEGAVRKLSNRIKPAVYNLSWFSQALGTEANPAPMPRGKTGGTISTQKRRGVVILYPALATPEILVGDTDKLEMLLLLQTDEGADKLKLRITSQLKISQGFDAEKKCPDRALFVDASGGLVGTPDDRKIEVKKIQFVADAAIKTASGRFSCYVEKHSYRLFVNAGYTTLYSVSISSKVLKAGTGNRVIGGGGTARPVDQSAA